MLKGAAILAIGFTLGYAKATQDSDKLKGVLTETNGLLKDFLEYVQEQDNKPNNPEGE